MTRINVGIPPKELHQKHLLAEHREIKRIPNVVKSGKANLGKIPTKFTLGTGHVTFFYNKLGYLLKRYRELYSECKRRGFDVMLYTDAWDNIPEHLMGDWEPTEADIGLIRQRIKEKIESWN